MTLHLRRSLWFLAGALALAPAHPRPLGAQCPDGSQPPCGPRQQSKAPPLDAKKWIVVPFGNVTRAPDVDWLRDASVNLLTLELGRWSDVSVVSDKRVADLLRALPAESGKNLSLSDGLNAARAAGAGMLVMGDFMKLGAGARVTANVFDVRTGNRVRTAEERIANTDSLLFAFGPLSRSVLALAAPPDSRSGDVGTSSLAAYQAYAAGVRDFNRFENETAIAHFYRALQLDSTFALAHLYVALIRSWGEPSGLEASPVRQHALTALRLGVGLPARERAFAQWTVAYSNNEMTEACEAVAPVVARDSSDVLALFLLGDCAFHEHSIVLPASDSLPARPVRGLNVALGSLRRALLLDPRFHAAFPHILDILKTPVWNGCAPRKQPTDPCDPWRGVVFRDGDTLLVQPVSFNRNEGAYWKQVEQSAREKPMVANLAFAQRIADEWRASDPSNVGAVTQIASVMVLRGEIERADSLLRRIRTNAFSSNVATIRLRMEIAIKLGRGEEARTWFDTLVKAIPDAPQTNVLRGSFELAFGRAGRLAAGYAAGPAYAAAGAPGVAYARAIPRLMMGLPSPNVGELEVAFLAAMRDTATCNIECRLNRVWWTQVFGLRSPRPSWPDYGTGKLSSFFDEAKALSKGDLAKLKRGAFVYDSSARGNVDMLWPDFGWSAMGAEMYLVAGDTVAALRTLRFAVDTVMKLTPSTMALRGGFWIQGVWPRLMLQRAQLAAATGSTDEARYWYDRVLDLWARADPEFQPDIDRIRAARQSLGNRAVP